YDDYGGIESATRGLNLIDRLEPTPQRDELELSLQITLGILISATRGYSTSEVKTAYARAEELSRVLCRREMLVPALWGLWVYHLVRADMAAAVGRAIAMLEVPDIADQDWERAEAYSAIGLTKVFEGQLADGVIALQSGLAAYDQMKKDPQD